MNRRTGAVPGAWFIGSVFGILALLFSIAWWQSRRPRVDDAENTSLSLVATLGGADTAGYARALAPREFVFPGDHGAHPDFRNEWWYFTGNLVAETGERFGYQFTLFRSALAPSMPDRDSGWATRQVWMAHFAVTDVAGRRFVAFDRFSREAIGLAGATAQPFRVWLEDWSVASIGDDGAPTRDGDSADPRTITSARADDVFPLRIIARREDVAIDLRLDAGRALVLNGDRGLSRKGPEPGNASFYYAFTRLPTHGTVHARGSDFIVRGDSWLDREWSTSALSAGTRGWDWFALQLDDRTELMVYRLRRDDGSTNVFSAGTHVADDGTPTPLASTDAIIEANGQWTSPIHGTVYPSGWRLRVPAFALDLEIAPALPDQELDLAFRYWEGAVTVRGQRAGSPVAGRGYVELTGY